jgi:DUF4097 and DUF4098 domain-containing protein YvlB
MKERKMILQMIEEGKITAEEGLALLEALEKTYQPASNGSSTNQQKEQREQFNKLKDDLQDATERIIGSANKGATKLVDLFGKAVQKLQNIDVDFDFDFSFGGVKVKEAFEITSFEAKDLYFSTSNGSIRCRSWEKEYAQIDVTAQVNKVRDEEEAKEKLLKNIEQRRGNEQYSFFLKDKKGMRVALEIYLPIKVYEALRLETNNGSVRIQDLEIEKLVIETTNGSIRIHDIQGEHVEGKTSNGRIQFQDVDVQKSELKTSNGSIHALGRLQTLLCETTNGSIRIEQEQAQQSDIAATTSNGSVRVIYPQEISGVYGELKTKHGKLQCSLPHTKVLENIEQVNQKSFTFEQGEGKLHQVKVDSNTGSIHIFERGEEE